MFKRLLPHICITLSLLVCTLCILIQFNPSFALTPFNMYATLGLCAAAVVTSGVLIARNNKD